MTLDATQSELLAELADDFADRFRRGERPTPEEYALRHPQLAPQIHELFPTVALMERMEPDGRPGLSERPGQTIGVYKLLEQIGEGAFGVVFMAEQQAPVHRKVAVKVLKPGMDTKQVVARFAAERQALAMMEHPNIATVLDAGETESGRPYFVMELVRGVAITEYCDANALPTRDRLTLFVQVCRAIQHAHTKGIIHRDLKPSNILVTLHDGAPVPKVIDFGVAKAICAPLTERTLFTNFAQVVGTPLYMSPEQAEMSGLDVDTRSDVYSLGVLLYELLTGLTPFDRERFRTIGIDEVRRIIREEEPPRPSMRVSTSVGALRGAVVARSGEVRRMNQLFRGELDWIVMRCLEKDRSRRYATADSLVLDLQRYLRDEPVQACPPSAWYRMRKLVRRNKAASLTAVGVVVAVILALVMLAVSNFLIRAEQARTKDERDRAAKSQRLAEDRAEEIRQGLERLTAANALLDRGSWYTRYRRWDDALVAYSKAVDLRKEHVSAWIERGDLYASLGLWDLASADFAEAFELQETDSTMRWYRHALLRLYLGDEAGYNEIRRRMRERFRGTLDLHFAAEMVRTCALTADSTVDFKPLVELADQVFVDDPGPWYRFYVLGVAHYRAGQYEQAAQRLRESLTSEPNWPGGALSYSVLAMAHYRQGHDSEARQTLDAAAEAIDRWTRQRYDPEGPEWVHHQGATAEWPITWWDWLECHVYYREARRLIDGVAPPEDPRLQVMRARAFAGLRKNFTADVEYAKALRLMPNDPQVLLEVHRSAGYSAVGRREWRLAASEFARASELATDDATIWRFRALAQFVAGERDAYRHTCASMMERFGETKDPRTAGEVLRACVQGEDSIADMSRLLPLTLVSDRMWHWGAWVRGAALYRGGKFEEAVQCFETAARIYVPRAWDWCFLAMAHHRLGHADDARRCLAEADRWMEAANRRVKDATLRGEDEMSRTQPAWIEWAEPALFPMLVQETRELLGQGGAGNSLSTGE